MSFALACVQPATGHPAPFAPVCAPVQLDRLSSVSSVTRVTPASRLEVRPAPELVSAGISSLDALTGGLPRGSLTEIYGLPSSGRTGILLSVIAAATQRLEAGALVDVSNAFDPQSAVAARVNLQQLLWVRCNSSSHRKHPDASKKDEMKSDMARLTQALKVTDLLVQSGGFGLIAIDLGDMPHSAARRIPLASWFRFRRAVENTHTVLLIISQAPCARTCASLLLRLEKQSALSHRPSSSQLSHCNHIFCESVAVPEPQITVHNFSKQDVNALSHARMLEGISIRVELERSRLERKPPQSDKTVLATRTAWCG